MENRHTDKQTYSQTDRENKQKNRKMFIRKAYFILQIGLVKKTLLRISIIRLSIIIWKQRIRFVRTIYILSISMQSSFSGWCWSGKDIIIRTMCWFFYYNNVSINFIIHLDKFTLWKWPLEQYELFFWLLLQNVLTPYEKLINLRDTYLLRPLHSSQTIPPPSPIFCFCYHCFPW